MASLPSVLDEIDRLFDELIRRPWGTAARSLVPAELREVDDGWMIELHVEGLRASDLCVEVHGRRLTVTGQRRSEQERYGSRNEWTRSQRSVSLQRTITLPAEGDPDSIEARLEGTTLSLHIRRRQKRQP